MTDADNPLLSLTAGDLMSRDVETIDAGAPLREAAAKLARLEVHGAPVVDAEGRCVGMLSVSDLARWVGRNESRVPLPLACSFQETCREPGGHESTLCRMPEGVCPLQRVRELPDGRVALGCVEPNSIPADWQVVALEEAPGTAVRDVMTTVVITAEATAPVPELARLMLSHRVHRLVVLDGRRPIGVVTVNDLLQVLAHPELAPAGAAQ